MARGAVVPLLLAGGIVGPVLFVTTFLVAGAVQPGYDPIRDHVSELALTPNGWIQRLNFFVGGLLLMCFAGGLAIGARRDRRVGAGIALGAVGVGLLIAGVYPTGVEHAGGSILVWFGLTGACFVAALGQAFERRYARAAYALVSSVVVFVFFRLAGEEWIGDTYIGNIAGLTQRISLITGFACVTFFAIWSRQSLADRSAV